MLEQVDSLVRREYPATRNTFLRCQIGRIGFELVDIGGSHVRAEYFYVAGFGETWGDAHKMMERNKSAQRRMLQSSAN